MEDSDIRTSEARSGGALACGAGGLLSVTRVTVSDPFAFSAGGAVSVEGGAAVFQDSSFAGCTASFFGGTFYVLGSLNVSKCTVLRSGASQVGSALLHVSGKCQLTDTTIAYSAGAATVVSSAVEPVRVAGGELSCNGVLDINGAAAEHVAFSDNPILRNNYLFYDDTYVSVWAIDSVGGWSSGGGLSEDPRLCAGAPTLCDAVTCHNNGSCVEASNFIDTPTCDCGTARPAPNDGEYVGRLCNEICGNGEVEGDEPCDDGNTVGGDGCSSACDSVAAGYICDSAGEKCVTDCGDGILAGDETCDDVDDPKCVSCEFVGSRILNDWEAAATAVVPLVVFGLIAGLCFYLDGRYPGTRHMDLLWMVSRCVSERGCVCLRYCGSVGLRCS